MSFLSLCVSYFLLCILSFLFFDFFFFFFFFFLDFYCFLLFFFFFFFSSRRRHTRCLSDWSSDVCSSDLAGDEGTIEATIRAALRRGRAVGAHPGYPDREHFGRRSLPLPPAAIEIGRASCRERV